MSQGCWVIDFTFTLGTNDTMNALYIPRIFNNDTLIPHVYSQAVQDTFGVEHFPCGNEGYDPSSPTQRTTACCLPTFQQSYRPIASLGAFLGTPYASGQLSVCNGSSPTLAPPSNFLPEADHLSPSFPDMPLSQVSVWVDEPYVRIWKGRARLDDHELRQYAAMLGETAPPFAAHTITTFLGLAHFSPTGTTTFLDSAASQTMITLTKNDWMVVAMISGKNEYTFFDYCNMRLHQVRAGGASLQWIAASFTLGSQYSVNENSLLIPPTSVRTGRGTFASTANWTHACHTAAMDATWDSPSTRAAYDAALDPDCAPDAQMCESPMHITQGFVVFFVPLGEGDASADASSALDASVFLDMVVSVVDKDTNEQWSTRFFGQLPLIDGGALLHCQEIFAVSLLSEVADVDVVVGIAGFASEWPRVKHHHSLLSGPTFNYNSSLDSDSIESGLISVILQGNETFFNMPGAKQRGFSLELEDVITVHFMEQPPHARFEQMFALIHAGGGFGVSINIANQQVSLVPTPAFVSVCPFTMTSSIPCVARRDVLLRGFPSVLGSIPTAMEVNVSDGTADEASFMQGILGGSEYAAQLGANFSQVLSDKFNLNRRYRRAWWVNPGFTWNKQQYLAAGFDRYSVSQRIMLVLLVGLDEHDGTRRRAILTHEVPHNLKTGRNSGGTGQNSGGAAVGKASFLYNVSPTAVVGASLGVPGKLVSIWSIQMRISHYEACLDASPRDRLLHDHLMGFLLASASPLQALLLLSVKLLGSEDCSPLRRSGPPLGRWTGPLQNKMTDPPQNGMTGPPQKKKTGSPQEGWTGPPQVPEKRTGLPQKLVQEERWGPPRERRDGPASGEYSPTSTVLVEMGLVFASVSDMRLSAKLLENFEAVIKVTAVVPGTIIIDWSGDPLPPSNENTLTSAAAASFSTRTLAIVLGGVAAVGVAAALLAARVMINRRARKKPAPLSSSHAELVLHSPWPSSPPPPPPSPPYAV